MVKKGSHELRPSLNRCVSKSPGPGNIEQEVLLIKATDTKMNAGKLNAAYTLESRHESLAASMGFFFLTSKIWFPFEELECHLIHATLRLGAILLLSKGSCEIIFNHCLLLNLYLFEFGMLNLPNKRHAKTRIFENAESLYFFRCK